MSKLLKESNFRNGDINPCIKESDLVQKCLEENLYNYKSCALYFENYKQCKKFWNNLSKERRSLGISPPMPTEKERENIIKKKVRVAYVPSTSE